MKLLCSECFHEAIVGKGQVARCQSCGREYSLGDKSSLFRIRLEGGYIRDGLTKAMLIQIIEDGQVLPDEYIATQNGPWMAVYDSPFSNKIDIKKITKERSKVMLYQKRMRDRAATVGLVFILTLSIATNVVLVYILFLMQDKISDMVLKLTGGV